jgi:hypothetical protein
MSDLASGAVTGLAWLAALSTAFYQRALVPLVLVAYCLMTTPPVPTPRLDTAALQELTRRQLQDLAGTRRNLPKHQLIDLVRQRGAFA